MIRPSTLTLYAALVVASGVSCGGCDRAEVEDTEDSAGSSEAFAQGPGVVIVEGVPPQIRLDAQACAQHSDCRVFQPGDWNERVECCYEYGCDLDYVAVNQETWTLLRQWQRDHPFDCVSHLREQGPCANRSTRCGLIQDAPAAACQEGVCRVATPPQWPIVDPEAQRCTSDADCAAYRSAESSPLERCCGQDCSDEWISISRNTEAEIDRWRAHHAPRCETWREQHECPPSTACALVSPGVTCRGGECRLRE